MLEEVVIISEATDPEGAHTHGRSTHPEFL
jgi:hypothetical protein